MKQPVRAGIVAAAIVALVALLIALQGCGGTRKYSAVSGTVADINRNPIVGATVWVDGFEDRTTTSLSSGAYRLEGIGSGWRTIRAEVTINGTRYVGSTAAEILENEPTFNIHIVLTPAQETMNVEGRVYRESDGRPVPGARVLLTTRLLDTDSDAYEGPFGSIVAVTDDGGYYRMEDVPLGHTAWIAASKVGYYNKEVLWNNRDEVNFYLERSALEYRLAPPALEQIESYTMPDSIAVRNAGDGYEAAKALISSRYRQAILKRDRRMVRMTPEGSLIEIDLYWNALHNNYSDEIAGYAIYRATAASRLAILDSIRDPYANFYQDTGVEITPNVEYTYRVRAFDVEYLDAMNVPDPNALSDFSDPLSIMPLDQLRATFPEQDAVVSGTPTFRWRSLSGAAFYKVFVYDEFPSLAPDPTRDYSENIPPEGVVTLPIWPEDLSGTSHVASGSATSKVYAGPPLQPGRTYYWFVVAGDETGLSYSFSEIRRFTVR